MPEQALSKRQAIIRVAFARFTNNERLRMLEYITDALERDGQHELTSEECGECDVARATGCMPWGDPVPQPRNAPAAQAREAQLQTDEVDVAALLAARACPTGECDG